MKSKASASCTRGSLITGKCDFLFLQSPCRALTLDKNYSSQGVWEFDVVRDKKWKEAQQKLKAKEAEK